jgi:hypothetical protein
MHYTKSWKVAGSIPDEVIGFINWHNPSSRNMALRPTQPLAKMSTRNHSGGKVRPAREADNLTAICEPIVYKMWEPRRLTNLWAFTASYVIALPLPIDWWIGRFMVSTENKQ